jgi:hypothetical protein
MTRPAARFALAAVIAAAVAPPLRAQTPTELIERGVQAYDELDLATAAGLLRRALLQADRLPSATLTRAMAYLGAAEYVRGSRDSSAAVFRRLVTHDPRYVLDELVFPPEITALYRVVKRDTKVVDVAVPGAATFTTGFGRLGAQLFASSFHRIAAVIERSNGSELRLLYDGAIGDSLEVLWDGLDAAGSPPSSGRYFLVVRSYAAQGETTRIVRVPLDVAVTLADTLPHPTPPADSILLPERTSGGRGLEALLGGLAAGVGIAILPTTIAPDAELSGTRIGVAGIVTIAGVIGFFTQRPGKPIEENIRANRRLRDVWQADAEAIARENTARRTRATLEIRTGDPSVVAPGT